MSEIRVTNLTFGYEGSSENIFEEENFSIDTNWKLGFIGRNGKGKTTFLRLLLASQGRKNTVGQESYEFSGSIKTDTVFDYFPYEIREEELEQNTIDLVERIYPDYELWRICCELDLLKTDAEILYRPFGTLSHGERTKVMLAVLFSRENYFLLIDEPTNHLDAPTRELVRGYLNSKKGFILVSHDRWLLDGCIDHVLVLERTGIRIEKGNFSSWWENKERRDRYEYAENEKLKGEIGKLRAAAERTARWADKVEGTKIGYDPVKEHDRGMGMRAYIGEKSRKMQQRRKNLERRQQEAIEEKEQLLHNVEEMVSLKLMPLTHHKERLIRAEDFCLGYGDRQVLQNFSMELKRGDRIVLQGKNGCGKSSLIREILERAGVPIGSGQAEEIVKASKSIRKEEELIKSAENNRKESAKMETPGNKKWTSGTLETASGLIISYINQDTSHLVGSLEDYIAGCGLSESLFKAVLRQIGIERSILEGVNGALERFSEGQKKKVLIAASLIQSAHLYIWDEPLNYIDVFSRMQIEKLIQQYQPTMLLVEHDRSFAEKCGTKIIRME